MGGTLKRILFWFYVAWVRVGQWLAMAKKEQTETEQAFIWKHFWFFMWHISFWSMGRWIAAHFTKVEPLIHLPTLETRKHYERFNELVVLQNKERSLGERFIQPTKYRLSAEAARELCLFYGTFADMAPWQYGVEARLLKKRKTRNRFLVSLVAFGACVFFYIPDFPFFAWITLLSFFSMLSSLSGWYGSVCLHDLARGAQKFRQRQKEEKT